MDGKFVSYLRVSTEKQGKSGLGVEAQREAVARHLNGGTWKLLDEYVETESGKHDCRPQLANDSTVFGNGGRYKHKDVLHRDGVFFEPHDFANCCDSAIPVRKASQLNHAMKRGCHMLPNHAGW